MEDVLDRKVLVLNKLYNPISVVTARDAFIKLFIQVAEVVTVEQGTYTNYDFNSWAEISDLRKELEDLGDLDDLVYTQRFTLIVPRVIRLIEFDKTPKNGVKLTRRNIYSRDGNTCQYCAFTGATDKLNLDHVIPKVQGGKNTWTNLVCSCFKCNTKKAGRTPEQAGMKLIRKPFKPKHNPVLKVHIAHKRYEAWKDFVSEAYWTAELQD